MVRTLQRSAPIGGLRIWTGGDSPNGRDLAAQAVVAEWAGRTGHPTSYAALGGAPTAGGTTVSVETVGPVFLDALAGRTDTVRFGLPDEYRREVEAVLATRECHLDILVAAHGVVGSSPVAFRRMATFLAILIGEEISHASEELVWDAWDHAGEAWRG